MYWKSLVISKCHHHQVKIYFIQIASKLRSFLPAYSDKYSNSLTNIRCFMLCFNLYFVVPKNHTINIYQYFFSFRRSFVSLHMTRMQAGNLHRGKTNKHGGEWTGNRAGEGLDKNVELLPKREAGPGTNAKTWPQFPRSRKGSSNDIRMVDFGHITAPLSCTLYLVLLISKCLPANTLNVVNITC